MNKKKSFKFYGATFVAILFFIGVLVAYNFLLKPTVLPIYNPSDLDLSIVDSSLQKVKKDFTIDSFTLQNQYGNVVSSKEMTDDKIYVVDFFFVTCKTICPVMTSQMVKVHNAFKNDDEFAILSFSVTPDYDTAEVLYNYAENFGVNYSNWWFLTGNKKDIYKLARKNYFLMKKTEVGAGDGGDSDFIHTNNFVLIDKEKRIRGYYDGTDKKSVNQLINDITILQDTYKTN